MKRVYVTEEYKLSIILFYLRIPIVGLSLVWYMKKKITHQAKFYNLNSVAKNGGLEYNFG